MQRSLVVAMLAFVLLVPMAAFAQSPADLERKISAKLVDAFGDDAKSIRVTYFDGKAILTGNVVERSTQELAEQVALFFPEVRDVDNMVEADKAKRLTEGKLEDEVFDAKLESEVKATLGGEIGAYARDIEVEAVGGVVTLRGRVPDQSRLDLARHAAGSVRGVAKTIDLLWIQISNG